MPRVHFKFDEEHSDSRSNEIAYRFSIENLGVESIELLSLTPRIPEGAELIEVKDQSLEALKTQHNRLCRDLSLLLTGHLIVSSEDFRKKRAKAYGEGLNEAIGHLSNIFIRTLSMLSVKLSKLMDGRDFLQFKALHYSIRNLDDAEYAVKTWFSNEGDNHIAIIFNAKVKQLKEIETKMGGDNISIATIEPESFFSSTYVIRFERKSLNPQKYNISVDGTYTPSGTEKIFSGRATTTVVISPRPYVLSFIAISSSLLGVILRYSINQNKSESVYLFFNNLFAQLISSPGISAIILSLVVFNTYEYTKLSKQIKIGIGWRSALLIGILCGLFREQILAALKSFISL